MTNDAAATPGAPIIFDSWRSISISLYMALVGYSVMVSVPVLSTAAIDMLGFSEEQVGRIWSADLGGMSLGALLSALLVARVNRRTLVLAGVVLSIVGNGLCILFVDYDTVYWLRIATGVGSGIFTAVAVVSLGGTTNPARAFNLLLFAFSFSAALELHLVPKMTMNEIYLFFIVLSALVLGFLRWLPARPLNAEELALQETGEDDVENWHVPRYFPLVCLVAVCFTYINIGGYFTYINEAAIEDGVAESWAGSLLTWSSFLAFAGCALALVATRFGLFKPLFVALLAMAATVMMLSSGITDYNLLVSLFGFMTLWTFADIFQSAMMARMDRTGSLVALLPAVQPFGQSLGGNVAASVVGAGLGYSTLFLVSGSMALVALLLYGGIFVYMNKQQSVLAEAT